MLFNLNKRKRVTEAEFRESLSDVSFGPVLKDAVLAQYRYAVLHEGTPPVAPLGAKVVDAGEALVDGRWEIQWEIAPQTAEEMQHTLARLEGYYTAGMQGEMDAQAKVLKYDNINSVCTYATSRHPKFGAEGRAAVAYRDDCWEYGNSLLQTVLAGMQDIIEGRKQLPTLEAVIAGMPKMDWSDPLTRTTPAVEHKAAELLDTPTAPAAS